MARMRANGLGPQGGVAAGWHWVPVPDGGLDDFSTVHRMTPGMEYAWVTTNESMLGEQYAHSIATYRAGQTIYNDSIFAIALTPRWLEDHPEYGGFLRSPSDRQRQAMRPATVHAMTATRDGRIDVNRDAYGNPIGVAEFLESETMAVAPRRQPVTWRETARALLPHDAPNRYGSPNGWRWWVHEQGAERPLGMPDNAVTAIITQNERNGGYEHSTREADSWQWTRHIVAWAFEPAWLAANPQYDVMMIKAEVGAADVPEGVGPEVALTANYETFTDPPRWYGPTEGWHWIRVIDGRRPDGIPDGADIAWMLTNEIGSTYVHQTQPAGSMSFNTAMAAIAIDPEWLRDNPSYTGPCSGRTPGPADPDTWNLTPHGYGDRDGYHWIAVRGARPADLPDDAVMAWMMEGEGRDTYSHSTRTVGTMGSDWSGMLAMALDPSWLTLNPDYTGPCSGRRRALGGQFKAKRIAPGNKPVPEPPMPIKHPPVPIDIDPVGLEDANHEVKAALRKVTQILEEAGRHGAEKLGAKMGALQATYEQRHTDLETAFKNMREALEAEYSRRSAALEADIEPRIAAEVERRVTEYKAQVTGRNVSAGKRKLEL
jgi:hypothetical protein